MISNQDHLGRFHWGGGRTRNVAPLPGINVTGPQVIQKNVYLYFNQSNGGKNANWEGGGQTSKKKNLQEPRRDKMTMKSFLKAIVCINGDVRITDNAINLQ